MGDIPERPVFILAAGHGHKQPFRPLYDLDIVDGKVAVDRDGNQRLQPGVLVNFANADIGDVHACFSFRVLGFLFRPDGLTVSLGSGREKYAPIPTFCGKIPRTIVKPPADGV